MITRFQTEKAPAAIGPYSQASIANGMIFTSGQIPLVADTMELVGDDVQSQTRQVLENIKALLLEAGSNLESVVKTTIFIKNMDDFGEINKIYEEYFGESKPARSTVEVARLPKDVLIEMEAIALIP